MRTKEQLILAVIVALLVGSLLHFRKDFTSYVHEAESFYSQTSENGPKTASAHVGNSSSASLPIQNNAAETPNVERSMYSMAPRRGPRVILGIGPHKTGTTSLQSMLKDTKIANLLASDQISMPNLTDLPGRDTINPEFNWAGCVANFVTKKQCRRLGTLSSFARYVNETFRQGKDILIIAEDMDRDEVDFQKLRESFKPYTEIQIVVTYRRLHEWYRSWFNEICQLYAKVFFQRKAFASFQEFIATKYDNFFNRHTMGLEQKYRNQGFPVSVLHFHRYNSTLSENFFCHTISNLPNTCRGIQTQPAFSQVQRSTSATIYKPDICRWAWHMMEYQVPKGTRFYLCALLFRHYQAILDSHNIAIPRDFPVQPAPTAVVERTWKATIQAETKYFHLLDHPSEAAPTEDFVQHLRIQFDNDIANKWFTVNLEELDRTGQYDYLFPGKIRKQPITQQQHLPGNSTTSQTANNKSVWNCLEVRDAQLYLDEWLDYHFALGFTFVRIFDNSPDFNMRNWTYSPVNASNESASKIKITHHPDLPAKIGTQAAAYKQCMSEALEQKVDWVATIDSDEFLVLKKHESVVALLDNHCTMDKNCGQLSFNWRMFGSANQTKFHAYPVTRRFQYYTEGWQGTIKTIVNPRAVDMDNFHWQHSLKLKSGYTWLDSNGSVIKQKGWRVMTNDANPGDVAVLNHYRYKSQEEWDIANCVRGNEYNDKAKKRCHTPAEVGTIFDDSAWKLLRKMVPSYQKYDDVGSLE